MATTLLPRVTQQDPGTVPDPDIEPDVEWKNNAIKQIQDALQHIVDEAAVKRDDQLNLYDQDPIQRDRILEEFEQTMTGLRRLANEQYVEALERERQERRWAAGQAVDAGWNEALVKEQQAILDALKRQGTERSQSEDNSEGTVHRRNKEAIAKPIRADVRDVRQETRNPDRDHRLYNRVYDEDQYGSSSPRASGSSRNSAGPSTSRVVNTVPWVEPTSYFDSAADAMPFRYAEFDSEVGKISRKPSSSSLSKAKQPQPQIWHPSITPALPSVGPTVIPEDRATSRTLAHASGRLDSPVSPPGRRDSSASTSSNPRRTSLRLEDRSLADLDMESAARYQREMEAINEHSERSRKSRGKQREVEPPRTVSKQISAGDFQSRRWDERQFSINSGPYPATPVSPQTPDSFVGYTGGSSYRQESLERVGIPIRTGSRAPSTPSGSPETSRYAQPPTNASRSIGNRQSFSKDQDARQFQNSPSSRSFYSPQGNASQSNISVARPIPSQRSFTADESPRSLRSESSRGVYGPLSSSQGPPGASRPIANPQSYPYDSSMHSAQSSPSSRGWHGPSTPAGHGRRDSASSRHSNRSQSSRPDIDARGDLDVFRPQRLQTYDEQSSESAVESDDDYESDEWQFDLDLMEQREEEMKQIALEEARQRAEEARKKEVEAKRKADEAQRIEEEARKKSEEARQKEEEAKRKEEEIRKKEEETRQREEAIRRREEEIRRREEELARREDEAREKEIEARRKAIEVRQREMEFREEELRRREEEARQREIAREEEEAAARKEAAKLEEIRQREEAMRRAEAERLEEEKRKEAEAEERRRQEAEESRRKEELAELKRKETEIKRKEKEARRKELEAKRREEEAKRKEEELRQMEIALREEEARRLELQRKEQEEREEAARIEAKRQQELIRRAEEARKVEEARRAEEARKAEARRLEEIRKANEARKAEDARKAEEARRVEEARRAEEVQRAEEVRKQEEARKEEERLRQAAWEEIERARERDAAQREAAKQRELKEQAKLLKETEFLRAQQEEYRRYEEAHRRTTNDRKRQDSAGSGSDTNRPTVSASSASASASASASSTGSGPRNIPGRSGSTSSASADRNSTSSSWSSTNGSIWSSSGRTTSSQTSHASTASSHTQPSTYTRMPNTPTPPAASTKPAAGAWKTSSATPVGAFPSSTKSATSPPIATPSPNMLSEEEWMHRQAEHARQQQERFQKMQEDMERKRQAKQSRLLTKEEVCQLLEDHERRWTKLATLDVLSWNTFPWPMLKMPDSPEELTTIAISAFVLSPYHTSEKSSKDRIKEHIRRWHPDRFETKYLPKVRGDDKEKVQEGAGVVARILNELLTRSAHEDLF